MVGCGFPEVPIVGIVGVPTMRRRLLVNRLQCSFGLDELIDQRAAEPLRVARGVPTLYRLQKEVDVDAADRPGGVGAVVMWSTQAIFGDLLDEGGEGLVSSSVCRDEVGGRLGVDGSGFAI